jgi:Lrp/AsnC family transcriptional regulator
MERRTSVVPDALDRKILSEIQRDATLSLDELTRRVGASKTSIWNRIRKLREAGVIDREVAILNPEATGFGTCFFVLIRTSQHEPEWLNEFVRAVEAMPEILSAHRLAGEIDYVLQVRVADVQAYDAFYRRLISKVTIFNVTSLLSMEEIKATTALPLPA